MVFYGEAGFGGARARGGKGMTLKRELAEAKEWARVI
jgi:hypothetical protein